MTSADTLAEIVRRRVVAVVRAPGHEVATDVARALVAGGITVIEVTFTTPDALEAIRAVAAIEGVVVGAGTLMNPRDADAAIDAGASFLMSPHLDVGVLEVADRADILYIPGAFTPTEIVVAATRVPLVKLFPASAGGPSMVRALLAPLPNLRIIPTGGVNLANLREWFDAGVVAVAAGGDLCPADAIARGDMADIEGRARGYIAALEGR